MVMKLKNAITAHRENRPAPGARARAARAPCTTCFARAGRPGGGCGAAAGLFFSYIEDRRGGPADGESR